LRGNDWSGLFYKKAQICSFLSKETTKEIRDYRDFNRSIDFKD